MRVLFFSKHSKFNAESKSAIQNQENILSPPGNWVIAGSGELSVLLRE